MSELTRRLREDAFRIETLGGVVMASRVGRAADEIDRLTREQDELRTQLDVAKAAPRRPTREAIAILIAGDFDGTGDMWGDMSASRRSRWLELADRVLAAIDGTAPEPAAPAAMPAKAAAICVVDRVAHLFEDKGDVLKFLGDPGNLWSVGACDVRIEWHPASGRAGGAKGEAKA